MNKLIAIISFLGLTIWACGDGPSKADLATGETVYKTYCVACHGADGKLGLNGAKNMQESVLTKEERITLITNGKGAMTSFKGTLSPEEIAAVADYTIQKYSKPSK